MIKPNTNQIDLKVEVAGVMFKNPVLPAAKDLGRKRGCHAF
jgi:hypothetical protein